MGETAGTPWVVIDIVLYLYMDIQIWMVGFFSVCELLLLPYEGDLKLGIAWWFIFLFFFPPRTKLIRYNVIMVRLFFRQAHVDLGEGFLNVIG